MPNITGNHVDVVIIGGGMAGVSLAARLAPLVSVRLLERETQLGYHSTSRSAAMFIPNYGTPLLRKLILASEDDLKGDAVVEGGVLSPRGELAIVSADESDALDAYLDGSVGLSLITPAEARELCPILSEERFVSAVYDAKAADIDVDRLFQGFIRLAKSHGADITTNTEVKAINRKGEHWQVVTNQGDIEAKIIVNASGAWASVIGDMASASPITITPCRRSAAMVPLPDDLSPDLWPMIASISETWYAKPDAGRLMVSPADQDPIAPCDAWADDLILAEGIDRFEQATTIKVTRLEHQWAGLRSFADDHEPVVGFDPIAPGFFWLAGQGGNGIRTAPALSIIAKELILDEAGPQTLADVEMLAQLSPGRFVS